MFDGLAQWTWVAIAWAEVALAYALYLAYLGRRRRRLLEDDRAQRLLRHETLPAGGGGP